jgi:molecular chaperone GrpE (heat shock protein)
MVIEEKSTEAPVQFELYRLIKNNLSASNSVTVQYKSVEPERGVKTGSVDLVVEARKANRIVPLLAVEVKKPSGRSYLLYTKESEKQIERYAKELQSQYSALTDGEVLRLFKLNQTVDNYTRIGDYKIQLNDNQIRRFLTELLKSYENEKQALSLSEAPPFSLEKFERELDGLTKTLVNLFEQLGQEDGFELKHKENRIYREQSLSFDSFKGVLSLSVEREKKEISKDTSYILLNLLDLRNKLGTKTLSELLTKLSKISCFLWVDPEKAEKDYEFTWKNLRDITMREEPKAEELKKQLTEWFFELAKFLSNPSVKKPRELTDLSVKR